jgi:hypothetical protein
MNTSVQEVLNLIDAYKPGLILLAAVLVLGCAVDWAMGAASWSDKDTTAALNRVYSAAAQPIVWQPAKYPPTR